MENNYQPHEQRVIEEFEELSIKLDKLRDFIDNNKLFQSLDEEDKSLLMVQSEAMGVYREVLERRIKRFSISN